MSAHISSGSELTPCGPSSLDDMFNWAPHAYTLLLSEYPEARALFEEQLWCGLNFSSHYSGKGTAESCALQLQKVMLEGFAQHGSVLGKDVSQMPQNPFQCVFAVDKSAVCRKALLATPCRHIFGSIEERLRPDLQSTLLQMEPQARASFSAADKLSQYQNIKDALFSASPPAYSADLKAFCYRHGHDCGIWADMDTRAGSAQASHADDDGDEVYQPLKVNVTGFHCTDWSVRRTGCLPGMGGKTAPSFWKWLCEIKTSAPDITFWECSPFFQEDIIENELGSRYLQATTVVGPHLLGWPVSRLRKFGVLLRKDRLLFLGSDDDFHRVFQRSCALTGDCFFAASPEYVLEMMLQRAKARGHHISKSPGMLPKDIKLQTMLTPATYDRLAEYESKFAGKCGPCGELLFDLDQNPGYSGCGPLVPSMPTHSSVYSSKHRRLLLGRELLFCMGALAETIKS